MINTLDITNFKNYKKLTASFSPGINFFVGLNGVGKTNLLDAIHYIGVTRSFTTAQDRHNVHFDDEFFRIEAEIVRDGKPHQVVARIRPGSLKEFDVDGRKVERLGDHLGFIPVIVLSPRDQLLISGASADRRRFIDFYLCQTNRAYLADLTLYNRLLAQRNAALKEHGWQIDPQLVMTYSEKMFAPADRITIARQAFLTGLQPLVERHYQRISDKDVGVLLRYASACNASDFMQGARESFDKDRALKRTTYGIHRDDMIFDLSGHPVKRFGSQGQAKTYLIALHLALYDVLRNEQQVYPVLLLDDIFDKLDDDRVRHLVHTLGHHDFGQVFITDARAHRIMRICSELTADARVFHLEEGIIATVHKYSNN